MRSLIVIPIVLAAVGVGAWFALSAMHVSVHKRDVAAAAGLCALSADLALLPAVFKRRGDLLPLFQAGLIGSVLHLLLTLVLGAVVIMAGLAFDKRTFLYVILVSYWASLLAMVMGLARFIREASVRAQAAGQVKAG